MNVRTSTTNRYLLGIAFGFVIAALNTGHPLLWAVTAMVVMATALVVARSTVDREL